MNKDTSIFVAGHCGMVGAAIVRCFRNNGFDNLLLRTRTELDLCDAAAVRSFYNETKPQVVIVAAAKVGGIHANNTYPAEFLHDNLAIARNTIHEARECGVERLLFLGSSCIYPRDAAQPMTEDCLLTGPLESTNEAYAIAKIAGLKLCQYYRKQYGVLFHSAMPTNLYGPGDNYHPENSHVLPALIRRFHEAREANLASVEIWGSGRPRREFLHVDDLAAGLLHLLQQESPPDWVNIGCGTDVTIAELAQIVADTVGYTGKLVFDPEKPDGTPRKLLDIRRLQATGWRPSIDLRQGIGQTYAAFKREREEGILRT